jgi:RNA recognition motif-containing protein
MSQIIQDHYQAICADPRFEALVKSIIAESLGTSTIPSNKAIKTLIVRNVSRTITEEELRVLFQCYGSVRDVYIPKNMDRDSPHFGTSKGFALIKYFSAEAAEMAMIQTYNKITLDGRRLLVEYAKADR